MDLADLTSGNLIRSTPSFHFQIITADADDNIFTDCAVTAGADYLITEDSHFAHYGRLDTKPSPLRPMNSSLVICSEFRSSLRSCLVSPPAQLQSGCDLIT
jgi:predicted nucleic acid-binding protein